ncbi:hypothetical protein [Kordia sp.]|uniref:hypothetical protein n=1 Tax=Kordia sp. TaxID=1965332 RepID=UPI0025B8620A|nr:hypothetical protein [Kordia sp.]MCH2197038.1 hypothetical protein [Kordia sp.]
MSKPIKNNLFRFVTLRNPQLIVEEEKDPGFVFFPEKAESVFYNAVEGLKDTDKAAALNTVSSNFSELKTRTETRKVNESLYRFASWLMRNKNELTFASVSENISEVALLTSEEELLIWENLIYQTVNKTSLYVREACIQLLIANKFLIALRALTETVTAGHIFTEAQQKEFTRRAHASVVISRELFANTETNEITKRASSLDGFERSLESFVAEHAIEKYKTLKTELKSIEAAYKKQAENTHADAVKNHRAAVQKVIDEAKPVMIQVTDELGNVRQERTYPDLKIPEFVPVTETVLDEKYLKGKISDASLNILKEQKLDSSTNFETIYAFLAEKTKTANQVIFKNKQADKGKTVNISGAKMNLAKGTVNPYCFAAIHTTYPSGEYGMMMQLATDYASASITSATFKIKYVQGGVEKAGLSVQNMASTSNTLTAFFHFDPFLFGEGTEIEFSGEFTLNNGKVYSFSSVAIASLKRKLVFNGCATLKGQGTGEPSTINANRIYGVTKLGIADFRRVEQEVCCYVPGEVSHIENILAREYKERETRNLNSIESTTEETREREVENLNDTTTTERNEMQSEVSAVLNEDKANNYGVDGRVNGKFPSGTYSVGSYADTSSSSSTSNSNSQAQTYAQEVTERAMERIVQKVSTKRTTRILREFEEKNTHGFDNTKGTEHITGVYRWVDKIYKNSLINYGKRLMYEFAIPEPSRFFKEAIKKQLEDQTVDSNIILPDAPEHPSAHGIMSAADLTVENYQSIAGHYGAEVNGIEINKTVSDSFSVVGNTYIAEHNYPGASNFKMEIPQGYMATGTRFNAGFVFVPKAIEYTYATVAVENHRITAGGAHWDTTTGLLPLSNIEDELAVSFTGADVGGIRVNVTAYCTITPKAFSQWQNETYASIYSTYEEQLRQYNELVRANEDISAKNEETIRFNPLFNRTLEKREIKRIAVELLAEQKGHTISVNNYGSKNEETSIAKVNKGTTLELHASVVKFFEQAFDWEIMAYVFYPYFYADEKDWKDLFQSTDAADPLFQAFLQSGMARAVVPVKPGFEEAVNWYMETGELWNGQGLVVDMDDDLYISVSEEMQTIEGEVEGTWETRIPTSLTIVQAESAALKEGGLPCYCKEHTTDNTVHTSTAILEGNQTEATPK